MYFPYDYIYPEQHSYMVELKKTLDAKAGHLGEGGREGYSYKLWWSAERLRRCMHDGGVHCVSRVMVCDASLCPNVLWMQGVYHSTIQATDSCASLHNHI